MKKYAVLEGGNTNGFCVSLVCLCDTPEKAIKELYVLRETTMEQFKQDPPKAISSDDHGFYIFIDDTTFCFGKISEYKGDEQPKQYAVVEGCNTSFDGIDASLICFCDTKEEASEQISSLYEAIMEQAGDCIGEGDCDDDGYWFFAGDDEFYFACVDEYRGYSGEK